MDKSTLTAIVVTAIIAAFVKEIVSGLVSLVKKTFKNKTIAARLKKAITVNKIMVVVNLGGFAYAVWRLSTLLPNPAPVTRWDVFNIAFYLCLATLCFVRLDIHGFRYLDELERRRREQAELKDAQDAMKTQLTALKESLKETSEILAEGRRERKALSEPADKKPSSEK